MANIITTGQPTESGGLCDEQRNFQPSWPSQQTDDTKHIRNHHGRSCGLPPHRDSNRASASSLFSRPFFSFLSSSSVSDRQPVPPASPYTSLSLSDPENQSSLSDHEKQAGLPVTRRRRKIPLFIIITSVVITMLAIFFFLLASFVFRASAQGSIVDLSYGKYQGTNLNNGVSQWLGMRYAAAPVGELRFAAPVKPKNFDGVMSANKPGPGCQGVGPTMGSGNSEDCLFLDVFAPSDATPDSKLPVYFYVQGGGLQAATAHQNATGLILAAEKKLVVVTITYRTGAFGFLASKEIQKDASLNNGFKDQRRALEWTKEHISKFGGDPDHVTLGGQSAGAGSVVQHLVAYGGRDDKLFHSVLMQSASVPPTRDVASSQFQYDNLVGRTSCKGSEDTLGCLRKLSTEDIMKGAINEPFPDGAGGKPVFFYNGVLDGDFIPDIPLKLFEEGKFIKVPTVLGVDSNEGTGFAPRKVKTKKESVDFLKNTYPALTQEQLDKLDELYLLGSQEPAPYWWHVSRAYGRLRYICPSLQISDLMKKNGHDKVWNYRYDVLDPTEAEKQNMVGHGSEQPAVWGPKYTGAPKSYYHENADIVPVVQGYWTSFMRDFDPNSKKAEGAPTWETWTGDNQLIFQTGKTRMIPIINEHKDQCKYLSSIAISIGQ